MVILSTLSYMRVIYVVFYFLSIYMSYYSGIVLIVSKKSITNSYTIHNILGKKAPILVEN